MIGNWVAKRFALFDVFWLGIMIGVCWMGFLWEIAESGVEAAISFTAMMIVATVAFAMIFERLNTVLEGRERVVAEVDWE